MEPVSTPTTRRVIIHRSYLERFGYTGGCKKCEAILRGDESRTTEGHSIACRRHIESCIEKDEVLGQRLQAARDRQDRFLAGEVRKGDRAHESTSAPAEVVEQIFEPEHGVELLKLTEQQ